MVLRARAAAPAQRAKYCGCSGTSARLLYCRARLSLSATFIYGLAPLLAPQAHRFLPGTVREREHHRLALRLELERQPRGRDERVARSELEFFAADGGPALPFDHRVDRAVG